MQLSQICSSTTECTGPAPAAPRCDVRFATFARRMDGDATGLSINNKSNFFCDRWGFPGAAASPAVVLSVPAPRGMD